MGFKKIDRKIGFAELALSSSMEKNRSLETLEQMNEAPRRKRAGYLDASIVSINRSV